MRVPLVANSGKTQTGSETQSQSAGASFFHRWAVHGAVNAVVPPAVLAILQNTTPETADWIQSQIDPGMASFMPLINVLGVGLALTVFETAVRYCLSADSRPPMSLQSAVSLIVAGVGMQTADAVLTTRGSDAFVAKALETMLHKDGALALFSQCIASKLTNTVVDKLKERFWSADATSNDKDSNGQYQSLAQGAAV